MAICPPEITFKHLIVQSDPLVVMAKPCQEKRTHVGSFFASYVHDQSLRVMEYFDLPRHLSSCFSGQQYLFLI